MLTLHWETQFHTCNWDPREVLGQSAPECSQLCKLLTVNNAAQWIIQVHPEAIALVLFATILDLKIIMVFDEHSWHP